jgi:hypothetical protein
MIYIIPISHRNLQSTFRLIALSSSGLKDARKDFLSAAASLCKLSGMAIEVALLTCVEIFSPSSDSEVIFILN